jgi:hypothetical protein
MNLHQLASPAINVVNPRIPVIIQVNAGYNTAASGKRTPIWDVPVEVLGQVQELTTRDLRQLDGLNITGSSRKVYLYGTVNAGVRVTRNGGDLITLPDGNVYLTTSVLEQWPDWVCVAITLQDGS